MSCVVVDQGVVIGCECLCTKEPLRTVLVVYVVLSWVTVRVKPPLSYGVPLQRRYPAAVRASLAWLGLTMTMWRNESL